MAMKDKLNSWPLELLAFDKRPLVTISADDSIGNALTKLQKENVLSAPVLNGEEFVGMATMSDFMTYVAFGCFKSDSDGDLEQFNDVELRVGDWIGGLHDGDDSLASAMVFKNASDHIASVLSDMGKGLHRVLLRMGDGSLRMVSQTDIIRFLFAYGPRFAAHGGWTNTAGEAVEFIHPRKETLESNGIGEQGVFSVNTTDTAIAAYRKMDKAQVRAAAVVDENGELVTTLSVSDLRGLTSRTLKSVTRPVLAFLQLHRGDFHTSHTCQVTDNLQGLMMKMLTNKVHRLWVVKDSKPVGVVSMTDIIRLYAEAMAQA